MKSSELVRRDFLKHAVGAVAVGAATPYFWTSASARAESKNDRPIVAAIGVGAYDPGVCDGGRGSYNGHRAAAFGDMAACCDVDQEHADLFASRYGGKCATYHDYRRLLERKDIDAVIIGTPDHWHTPIVVAALRAGKDVFCEKPLTLTIDEGKVIRKVAKQAGRVFQVGTQQRSEYDQMFLKAVALARSGRLGTKLTATCAAGNCQYQGPFPNEKTPAHFDWDFWLGQTPKVPYSSKRGHYWFRFWLEYTGGEVTNMGVHWVDIAQWALGCENTGPVQIEGTGTFPFGREVMRDILLGKKPMTDLPNSFNVPSDIHVTLTFQNGNKIVIGASGGVLIEGKKGRILVTRGRLTGKPIEELTANDKEWLDRECLKLCHGKRPGNHMQNFFECMKDRSTPISDVFTHLNSVNSCHLANIAMLLGRPLQWDPDKETFIGDDEACRLLTRPQRKPYTIEQLTS